LKAVFLDTGVLGVIVHPRATTEARECLGWLRGLVAAGVRVCVPEICDYELRRELVRRGARVQIDKLDALKAQAEYVPIDTEAMLEAANLWAGARNAGYPTAHPEALDGDVILSAQARLDAAGEDYVIATTNPVDINRYAPADSWRAIVV
jgi:predicted nucleic acid-binding protein